MAACGRAPVALQAMDAGELAQVAALCDDEGNLCGDGQEKLRLLLVTHYERLKATDADLE